MSARSGIGNSGLSKVRYHTYRRGGSPAGGRGPGIQRMLITRPTPRPRSVSKSPRPGLVPTSKLSVMEERFMGQYYTRRLCTNLSVSARDPGGTPAPVLGSVPGQGPQPVDRAVVARVKLLDVRDRLQVFGRIVVLPLFRLDPH